MSLHHIIPIMVNALLLLFHQLLHSFGEDTSVVLESKSAPLPSLIIRGEPLLHRASLSGAMMCNICQSSPIKMCACMHYVDGFISYTYSSYFNNSLLFITFLLSHAVFTSVLGQHSMMNFCRFHFLCPKKSHHDMLFNNGAIPQYSTHVYFTLASTRTRAHCCVCLNYHSDIANMLYSISF